MERCLNVVFCCGLTHRELDETTELIPREKKPAAKIILPNVHLNKVSAVFERKVGQCRTTPVPFLGTYGVPFPTVKSIHIIQDSNTTLQIISFQYKPSDHHEASINLHHVLFPNYRAKGDPGERGRYLVDINEIKVNGESKPAISQQPVHVHDGRFSPKLGMVVDNFGDEAVSVSATITIPEEIREDSNHLYYGISQIKMLNILFTAECINFIDEWQSLEEINPMLDDQISVQIKNFISGS